MTPTISLQSAAECKKQSEADANGTDSSSFQHDFACRLFCDYFDGENLRVGFRLYKPEDPAAPDIQRVILYMSPREWAAMKAYIDATLQEATEE